MSGIFRAVESSKSGGGNYSSCFHGRLILHVQLWSRWRGRRCVSAAGSKQRSLCCPRPRRCSTAESGSGSEGRTPLCPHLLSALVYVVSGSLLQNLNTHARGSPLSCFECQTGREGGAANGSLKVPQTQTEQLSLFPADKRNQGQY